MEHIMNRTFRILLFGLLTLIATSGFAADMKGQDVQAGGQGMVRKEPHGPGGFTACLGKLNLTREQAEKMSQIRERFHGDTQAVRYELFQKNMELRALYADPKASDSMILAKQKELDGLRQKIRERLTQFRLDQRRVLTAEQLKTLGESECGPFLGGDFHHGGGSSPGGGAGQGGLRGW